MRKNTLLLLMLILLSFACNKKEINNLSKEEKIKIENLEAFTRLYGYIRYFHPSDEASTINWDKFVYYGVSQVLEAKDKNELKETLEELFIPIAPELELFYGKKVPEKKENQENMDGLVLVTWQHKGVGINENSTYKSVRIGRIDSLMNIDDGVYQVLKSQEYGGKKFRITSNAYISGECTGGIDLNGYSNNEGDFKFSKTFNDTNWETITLEGTVKDNTDYLYISLRKYGSGKVLFDNINLQFMDENGNYLDFPLDNSNFDKQKQNGFPQSWHGEGFGNTYRIENIDGKSLFVIESIDGVIPGSLFKEYCNVDDLMVKRLNNDLKCMFPTALLLSKKPPVNFSSDYDSLILKLDSIKLEENNAQLQETRLGAIIQAWNILQHFYPYFDIIETDWNEVLTKTLTKTLKSKELDEFFLIVREMLAALHDGHAWIYHDLISKDQKFLRNRFKLIENKIVVCATNNENVQVGDILLEIDGYNAKKLLDREAKYFSGSPQYKYFNALNYFAIGHIDSVSNLKVVRELDTILVTAARKGKFPKFKRPEKICKLNDDVYYVNLCEAQFVEIEREIDEIANAKGVIFDMRGYPNGNTDVISYMIDKPVGSSKWLKPLIIYPDQEDVVGYDSTGRWSIEPKEPRIKGEMVFLTNENAVSYGESLMEIIEYNKLGEIIGSPTAGTNGNINPFTTLGDIKFWWTGMKVLKQDNSQLHLIGVQPTIQMKPTIKGIREGRDEILEKALEIISN